MVADGKYVLGKPLAVQVTDVERELLLQAGATRPLHCTLLAYSKLLLHETNRVITTDRKQTQRNNSCILYKGRNGSNCHGLLQNILHESITSQTFAVVVPLKPAGLKLCSDDTTNVDIDSHIVVNSFPRCVAFDCMVYCFAIIMTIYFLFS